MNKFMQEQWPTFEGTFKMRAQLFDSLNDSDLAFSPGGQNVTFGALCREMGEVDYSYLQSLKTLKQDWSYRNTEPGLESSISKLKAWYQSMEADMKSTLEAMSDDDLKKVVERGFTVPIDVQMQIYLQALLIFFGKASVYVRAMNKALPQSFKEWIG
jgi:hypothetical protein